MKKLMAIKNRPVKLFDGTEVWRKAELYVNAQGEKHEWWSIIVTRDGEPMGVHTGSRAYIQRRWGTCFPS